MNITMRTIEAFLLTFVLLGSAGALPDPDLIVEQVLDELDAFDLVGSSSRWSHRQISLKPNQRHVLRSTATSQAMSRRNSIFRRSVARIMDHGLHDEAEAREAVRRVIRCIGFPVPTLS